MARPIVMPSLGMYTAEGTLTAWLRPTGSPVQIGEPIVEITTEKATHEVEAPVAGTLHHVAEVGTVLPVQALIGYVLAAGEAPPPGEPSPMVRLPIVPARPTAPPPVAAAPGSSPD